MKGRKGGRAVAGIAGGLVGTALGAGVGYLLSDDKRRKKVIHTVAKLRDDAIDAFDEMPAKKTALRKKVTRH